MVSKSSEAIAVVAGMAADNNTERSKKEHSEGKKVAAMDVKKTVEDLRADMAEPLVEVDSAIEAAKEHAMEGHLSVTDTLDLTKQPIASWSSNVWILS